MAALPIQIKGASGVPFHRQIADQVADLIRTGRIPPDARLCSSRELAGQLLVSLVTIQRAYDCLEQAGLIERRDDSGAFVAHGVARACRDRALAEACQVISQAVARAEQLGLGSEELSAIERERLAWEVEMAAGVQRRHLPDSDPDLPGWDISGLALPCREIGGDLYHYLPASDGSLFLALADVTGKGIPAALLVSSLHASLHHLVEEGHSVEEAVRRASRQFHHASPANRFAGLFLARLHPRSGRLESVNAGQDPPLLLGPDGEAAWLDRGGTLLGLDAAQVFNAQRSTLEPGGVLVAYTDGITEAVNPGGEPYGRERLSRHIGTNARLGARALARSLVEDVQRFTVEAPPADDRTVLVVKRREEGP